MEAGCVSKNVKRVKPEGTVVILFDRRFVTEEPNGSQLGTVDCEWILYPILDFTGEYYARCCMSGV